MAASVSPPSIVSTGLKPPGPGYFLSDGEITPELTSPAVSRPPTPKSDTEMEPHKTRKQSITTEIANQWNWNWGQLPVRQSNSAALIATSTTTTTTTTSTANVSATINNSKTPATPPNASAKVASKDNVSVSTSPSSRILGGMLNLITSSSNINNGNNSKGIYLDDTEKLDSEVAALYLDQKSNKSPPQISSCSKLTSSQILSDDDQESGKGVSLPQSPLRDSYSILGGDFFLSIGWCIQHQDD